MMLLVTSAAEVASSTTIVFDIVNGCGVESATKKNPKESIQQNNLIIYL